MHKNYHLVAVSLAVMCLGSPAVFAQDSVATETEETIGDILIAEPLHPTQTTITVTGAQSMVAQSGQAVSIMAKPEIERLQSVDVASLLQKLPSVSISRNGPLGGFAGVRVRGAEAEQLVVLIDGVRMADVAAPGAGFDFGSLMSGGISKIELLRGANSVVWGSDAIGGVLAITSDTDNKYGGHFGANFEGGSLSSRAASASANYGSSTAGIGVSGGWAKSNGFSSALVGTEADGHEQFYVNGRGRVSIGSRLELSAGGRYGDGYAEQDGYPPPTYFAFMDTNEYQKSRVWSGFGSAKYRADAFEAKLGYAISDTKRDNFDPAFGSGPGFSSKGRSERLSLNGTVYLGDESSLKLGAENVHDSYQTGPFGSNGSTGSKGAFVLFDMAQTTGGWNSHALAIGARIDDHKQFGTHASFGANGRYFFTHFVSLRGSVQTGFKAPTLFQLLSDYGNRSLNPETSFGFDMALALGDRNGLDTGGSISSSIGLFNRLTSNQIDFISCFGVVAGICTNRPYGTYDNIKRTRARGIEAEARWWASERLNFQGAYSYVDARNRSIGNANFGKELARRPQHLLSASADWNSKSFLNGDGVNLGADIRYASRAFDDNGNNRLLADYTLVTLRGAVPIGNHFQFYARVENLFDAQNQTASEYGSYGRGIFAGVRAAF